MYIQNLIKIHQFVHKILSENKILTITKGKNCVVYLCKLACGNPNLDLVNVYAYAKFDLIPSIPSEDIEQKQSLNDRKNHRQAENSIPHPQTICWGGGGGEGEDGGEVGIINSPTLYIGSIKFQCQTL